MICHENSFTYPLIFPSTYLPNRRNLNSCFPSKYKAFSRLSDRSFTKATINGTIVRCITQEAKHPRQKIRLNRVLDAEENSKISERNQRLLFLILIHVYRVCPEECLTLLFRNRVNYSCGCPNLT